MYYFLAKVVFLLGTYSTGVSFLSNFWIRFQVIYRVSIQPFKLFLEV